MALVWNWAIAMPTPALSFYETDVLPSDEVAGLIIATASHNPPEWQGIKFNPRLGYPAPTNVTDFGFSHQRTAARR